MRQVEEADIVTVRAALIAARQWIARDLPRAPIHVLAPSVGERMALDLDHRLEGALNILRLED